MPFRSEAQRRFLWAKHPDIAKRWASEYGTSSNLPEHVGTKRVPTVVKTPKLKRR